MKNNFLKTLCMMLAVTFTPSINAQTVSDFENLTLSPDSYWNGSTQPLGATFTSGNAEFHCYYDTSFGGFWSSGWAYSNKTDTVTAGFLNQYSARAGSGFYGSANYVIGQLNAFTQAYPTLRLNGNAAGRVVEGFYVTNGTYSYLSMRDGDGLGKQFGSPNNASGSPDGTNGEDWFLLTVKKWYNGTLGADSVNFYLADFRFTNNAQDYIVDTWEWVDLTSLGNVDSLLFSLRSSDVGSSGMNTPAYFCMDHFTTSDVAVSIFERNSSENYLSVYPNPATEFIKINFSGEKIQDATIRIFNNIGKLVHEEKASDSRLTIATSQLDNGLYRIVITSNEFSATQSFVKQQQ